MARLTPAGSVQPGPHPSATEVITALGLVPLPSEGGYFRETYRSADELPQSSLPARYQGAGGRRAATAIFYFLTPDTYSALHRLRADEIYHFYRGDPVELFTLNDAGNLERRLLGGQWETGQACQAVVPAGVWQGSRLADGGSWALLGTTVAPGFEFADCELATAEQFARFPAIAPVLKSLLAK